MLQSAPVKPCPKCEESNPDDARYCQHCGEAFAEAVAQADESELWRRLIGPNSTRYLEQFQKFRTPSGPRYALTWHWPAFLFDPFLWFLYRKMYLYAAVYAVGPVLSFVMTKSLFSDIVWRVGAAVSANYVYYWHVKEKVDRLRGKLWPRSEDGDRVIADEGGVQAYVFWLGVVLFAGKIALLIAAMSGVLPAPMMPGPQGG